MVEYSEEVKTLAETLKNSGLAASMTDALDRAQSMIGTNKAMNEGRVEEPAVQEADVAQTTLGNVEKSEETEEVAEETVNEAVEITSPESEELNKEEVFADKAESEQKEPESSQEKISDVQPQKKIDLSEIFNVNK